MLAARSRDKLEEVAVEARELGAEAIVAPMDVTDDASVTEAVGRVLALHAIDVLVNNAGVFQQVPFMVQDPAWRRYEMEVNFFGAQRVTRAVLPSMMARGDGRIINVSSLLGAVPCASMANYPATMAALPAWTHALRGEVAGHGVRVTVFMPSHTATESAEATTFDGVYTLPLDYTVRQLLRAVDKSPRSFAASPVFRMFLRLAGVFPGWAERRMLASTRSTLERSASEAPLPSSVRQS